MMFVNRTVYLAFFMKITLNVLVGSSSAHSATSYGTSRGYHALNKCRKRTDQRSIRLH